MKIVAAAVKFNGVIAHLPAPARHHDVIHRLAAGLPKSMLPICRPDEQGFITDEGLYVDRREARKIAEAAKQLIPRKGLDGVSFVIEHDLLFSEDVW